GLPREQGLTGVPERRGRAVVPGERARLPHPGWNPGDAGGGGAAAHRRGAGVPQGLIRHRMPGWRRDVTVGYNRAPGFQSTGRTSVMNRPGLITVNDLPDVARHGLQSPLESLDWVGMSGIRQPLLIRDGRQVRTVQSRVQIY